MKFFGKMSLGNFSQKKIGFQPLSEKIFFEKIGGMTGRSN